MLCNLLFVMPNSPYCAGGLSCLPPPKGCWCNDKVPRIYIDVASIEAFARGFSTYFSPVALKLSACWALSVLLCKVLRTAVLIMHCDAFCHDAVCHVVRCHRRCSVCSHVYIWLWLCSIVCDNRASSGAAWMLNQLLLRQLPALANISTLQAIELLLRLSIKFCRYLL